MVQYNKMCVIRGKHVCNQKCVQRPIITHTVAANKTCVLCDVIAGIQLSVMDEIIPDGFHYLVHVRCELLCLQSINIKHCITKLSIQLHK